ncbi:MAG: hypothetical protein LBI06_06225, partial [Treponema sp.]|nr:hypothetical protein [Treponema sp.]
TGELFGFVGAKVDIGVFLESINNSYPYPYGIGRTLLISEDGTVAAATEKNIIGKNFLDVGADMFGIENTMLLDHTLKTGDHVRTRYNESIIANFPIQVKGTTKNWALLVEALFFDARNLQVFTIVFAMVMMIIAAVIVAVVINTQIVSNY